MIRDTMALLAMARIRYSITFLLLFLVLFYQRDSLL